MLNVDDILKTQFDVEILFGKVTFHIRQFGIKLFLSFSFYNIFQSDMGN